MIIGDIIKKRAKEIPDKSALICRNRKVSYKELFKFIKRISYSLIELGIKKGDRVGIYLPNSIEFGLSYYSIINIGAIAVPIDPRIKGDELKDIYQDAGIKMFIAIPNLISLIKNVSSKIETIIVNGIGENSFERIINEGKEVDIEVDIGEEDEALYLYTSGTTGKPKGVVLTCKHLDFFPAAMGAVIGTNKYDILGGILPMSHISGPIYLNEIIDKGSSMVIFDNLRPDFILSEIERNEITGFHAVPPIFRSLLQFKNYHKYNIESLKWMAMMGTTVPFSLMEEFKRRFPHVAIIQGYGLTETSPLLTLTPLKDAEKKMASIGKPIPNIELKIVDENDREVPVGEIGEIVTRGPHVMKEYHNNPEDTISVMRNGWFHTGDMGKFDLDGYIYHMGRKDDMVITGGLNVYPAEIENILITHPCISEAAVIGIPDNRKGNVLKAFIVLNKGLKISKKEVMAFLKGRLASFKVPRYLEFRENLPKNTIGKIVKNELR
jgi:acyl-CoA synthetase (AMP-forming)/AMP-acid ligase II